MAYSMTVTVNLSRNVDLLLQRRCAGEIGPLDDPLPDGLDLADDVEMLASIAAREARQQVIARAAGLSGLTVEQVERLLQAAQS